MVAANRIVLTRVLITVIADLHNISSCSSKLFRPKVSLWSEKCLNKLFGDSNPALRSVHTWCLTARTASLPLAVF